MIESVIEFRDTTAGHIMTTRPDIIALPVDATLEQVKHASKNPGIRASPFTNRTSITSSASCTPAI